MIVEAGIQSDEFAVEAAQLNQTHIGLAFGSNMDDGTVMYGRIAAFHISDKYVAIHLEGVGSSKVHSTLRLGHADKLHFSQYTRERQMIGTLERIEANTNR
jgi:hypothetical protein